MKKLTFLLAALLISTMSFAQNAPIDFEVGGYGASWTWNVFENDTNPPLEIIANPFSTGINTSATVAKFTALLNGNPWAGTESAHGSTNLGTFVLDTTNSIIKIKVYKPVISDVGIKLVSDSGWALPEIKVANTLINQWEELTFDFSNYTNPPAGLGVYDQIVVFPDFDLAGRTQTNICYFDDITFSAGTPSSGPTVAAPAPPPLDTNNVISVFSNAFPNLAGTDFNPFWGQSTVVTQTTVQNDDVLRYGTFNYQGTQFAAPINASGMDYLHIDLWTADTTGVNIYCVSSGPVEKLYALPITPNQWVSYDIPVSAFTPTVDLTDIIQFKFDGGTGSETLYLDNIYFYIAPPSGPTVAAPAPPALDTTKVISVFSNAFTDVSGTDFNPFWGQSTVVSTVQIQNDDVLKYENFNYQGTQFASAINASAMNTLHLDMWTANATAVNIFCVSTGPVETAYALPITTNQWVSYDIPLTAFAGVDLADIIQFKFDGGTGSESIYLDNLYFYLDDISTGDELSDDNSLNIYPNPVNQGQSVILEGDIKEFRVYDITGKTILTGNQNEISTNDLIQGMYIIVVESHDSSIHTQKLIVN